jgi:hypothetical protein
MFISIKYVAGLCYPHKLNISKTTLYQTMLLYFLAERFLLKGLGHEKNLEKFDKNGQTQQGF